MSVKESETILVATVRSPRRGPSYTTATKAECLGHSHAGSLVVGSVSVRPDEPYK